MNGCNKEICKIRIFTDKIAHLLMITWKWIFRSGTLQEIRMIYSPLIKFFLGKAFSCILCYKKSDICT